VKIPKSVHSPFFDVERAREWCIVCAAGRGADAAGLPPPSREGPAAGPSWRCRTRTSLRSPFLKVTSPPNGTELPSGVFVTLSAAYDFLAGRMEQERNRIGLAEFDPIAYIHPYLLLVRGTDELESDGLSESPCKNLHRQAGPISGVYPPLHTPAPSASGRNRHAGIFSSQPTFGSPDGANPGARRIHQKATKNSPQHRSPR
jgi:hypothetical protein